MNNSISIKESIELLMLNHQQIHENIKFADQKAAAILAVNGALLAFTYGNIEPRKVSETLFAAGFLASLILLVAIGFAFWVVRPRGEVNRDRGPGVVDAIRIALYSHDQFQERLEQINNIALLREVRAFIYDRAKIDYKKYFYLRISLVLSFIGWIIAIVCAALVKLPTIIVG